MRVLVTGSQLWTDKKLVLEELDLLLLSLCEDVESEYVFTLVHGDCPDGADSHADEWGRKRKAEGFPIVIETHPADWKGPRKRGSGYARNAEMVNLGADLCLAFILDESPGSTHCSKLAEKAGIDTRYFRRQTQMQQPKRVDGELVIENARLIFRNFAGEERLYNNEGKRKFSILLDEDQALSLADVGWNIKSWDRTTDEGKIEKSYHLPVNVKFGRKPPRIFMITKSRNSRTPLDEDMVMLLDYAELDSVDVIVRPYNYDVNGSKGVTAYLKTLFATLHEDDLEKKYAHIPLDSGDEPLELENVIDVESEWVDDDDEPKAIEA